MMQHIKMFESFTQPPPVTDLPDGEYEGTLHAHVFNHDNKSYYSELGVKTMIQQPWKIVIKDHKVLSSLPKN